MRLVAVFESWHIPDGNYPPFDKDERVRLSFELDDAKLESATAPEFSFKSHDDATCAFGAEVLGRYGDLLALDAGGFRFYIHGEVANRWERGSQVRGTGILALDHYAWFEGVSSFTDPPNLFYDTKVTRIRKVRIPERFIRRQAHGKALPTTVRPRNYSQEDVEDLATMKGQSFDEVFYLLDLDVPSLRAAG